MIINPNGIITIVQCFGIERMENKQILFARGSHQRINTLLIFGYLRGYRFSPRSRERGWG